MNTVLKKYGAGLFSLVILILTAVAPITVWNLVSVLQLASLVLSSILSVGVLGLLPGKWPGGLKTGIDILGAAVALVLPFAIQGHISQSEIILVVIGVIKAAATEFGVVIRTDSVAVGTADTVVDSAALKVKTPAVVTSATETPGTVSQ